MNDRMETDKIYYVGFYQIKFNNNYYDYFIGEKNYICSTMHTKKEEFTWSIAQFENYINRNNFKLYTNETECIEELKRNISYPIGSNNDICIYSIRPYNNHWVWGQRMDYANLHDYIKEK